jgi:PAS domain S-box-containing protein
MLSDTLQKNHLITSDANLILLDQHPLPTWIIHKTDFRILFANKAALSVYEYTREQFQSIDFLSLHSEESKIAFLAKLSDKSHGTIPLRFIHKKNTGDKLFVKLFFSDLEFNNQKCLQISAVDVTKAFEREQLLETEKNRYKGYIEQSTEGIFCQEFDEPVPIDLPAEKLIATVKDHLYLTFCNDAFVKMYGYSHPEEMQGAKAGDLIDFNDPNNIAYIKSFIKNGFKTIGSESHEKDRDGNSRYFINNAIGIIEDGLLKRIWGTQSDITERKKIEKEIKFLAQLVEQTSDVLTASDLDFKPITWNKGAERIYGLKAQDVIGKDLREFIQDFTYQGVTKEQVREILGKQGEWRGEMHFTRPTDKKKVTLLIHFKTLKDANNVPMGYVIGGADITERKEAELRLKESENRFKEVADSAPVMIWMANADRITTYVNKMWLDFTGEDVTNKTGAAWSVLVHPEDLENARLNIDKVYEKRQPVTNTYRLRQADGTYRWVQDVSVPRFLKDGTFIGYIGSVVDIHDQKEKEEQLRYQANLLENVTDIIVTTDMEFHVQTWNNVAEKYYGIKAGEAIGNKVLELVDFKLNHTTLEAALDELFQKGIWSGEASFHTKEGDLKHVHYIIKFVHDDDGNRKGVISVGRDITESVLAKAKVEESELFYRTLIDDSHNATLLLDETGRIKFTSKAVENILGYTTEEVIGHNAFEFINHEDLGWALESFEKEKTQNPEFKSIVVRLKKKDGNWIWCMIRGHNMLDNPYVKSMVIHFHDDTLRKKASDALKESEKRFRSLIKDLQIGVFLANRSGEIVMCNTALGKMLSIPEEMLIGKNVYDIMSDNMIDEKGNPIPREERPLTKTLQHKEGVRDYVIGVKHPITGEQSWIMVNSNPVLNDAGEIEHVICSVMNITERKKLEQKLLADQINHQKQLTQATIDGQENERRELGKELHDNIGQQLTTVKLFLDMAKSNSDNETNEMLNMAVKGVTDLINEVRAMSRSLVPHTLNDLGLTESLIELISSINRLQSLQITFSHQGFEEKLLADNKQLMIFRIVQEQLNNIIKHSGATEAMVNLSINNNNAVLTIKDNGQGFDLKSLKKGLGFTNIRNRAELFGGQAQILSAPGEGCLIKVSIPVPDFSN